MPSSGVQTCALDRKSTRLNSSHTIISYAVFCLKKQKNAAQPVSTSPYAAPPRRGRTPTRNARWAGRPGARRERRRVARRDGGSLLFFNDAATTEMRLPPLQGPAQI